jgi:uncharacterized protein (TIGR02118 family)
MYKLTVLFRNPPDITKFEEGWPAFVIAAEAMPGVLRVEVSSSLSGPEGLAEFYKIHEFYFASRAALDQAMMSEEGTHAGHALQALAPGGYTLLFAEAQEDIVRAAGKPPEQQGET